MRNRIFKTTNQSIVIFISGLLSFVVPIIIVALAYFGIGIYPGGKSMVLTYDLRAQLLPLYGYLSNGGGPGFDNLFHSMSGGLGGGFFGTIALYLSPLDFIYCFVPVKHLPDAIYFMILFKIGLCGLFCYFLIIKNKRFHVNNLYAVTLACCYALMSYNFTYSMSPMWYDAIMLLPLLALSLEKIINGNKSPAFIILLTLCIISDYYFAYMNIIALTLYFLFRLIEEGIGRRTSVKYFMVFVIHGVLSAGMSLFVLIPVVLDFGRGKFAEGDTASVGVMIKNTFFEVIRSFMSQSYSGLGDNASPNIFCGSVVLILFLIWMLYGKRNIRSRIAGFMIVVFYFASFIFGPLDRFWHGFRDPVCFSVRYAFTFDFFMICFAVRGLDVLTNTNISKIKSIKGFITTLVILYTTLELYVNGSFIIGKIGTDSGYTLTDEYYRYCDVCETLIPYDELKSDYGRLITNFKCTGYDGALYGYDGISKFSSSYNFYISDFFRNTGVSSLYHSLGEKGVTPPVLGLINTKYYLSYFRDMSDMYSPVAESRRFTLYKNDYSLPLAFEISNESYSENSNFVNNPFINIDTVFSELFESMDTDEWIKLEDMF